MAPTPHQRKEAKAKALTTGKQPKARAARYLRKTEAHLEERDAKACLLLRGIRCSENMVTVLRDLKALKAPDSKLLSKNNGIAAFDDASSLEFLTTKNDCSLFALASHNKKRPNNLIFGRTFDHQILDMVECGLLYYKGLSDYPGVPKKRIGSKPLMMFVGDLWHLDISVPLSRFQNLMLDFFRGVPVDDVPLIGVDHLMVFTAARGGVGAGGVNAEKVVVHMRTYHVKLRKAPEGGTVPVTQLTPSGPDMDMTIRRTQFASSDLWNTAMKKPRQDAKRRSQRLNPRKQKNVSTNVFGETLGKLHLPKQDVHRLGGKYGKALRVVAKEEKERERGLVEKDLEREEEGMREEFRAVYGFEEEEGDGKSGKGKKTKK